MQKVVVNESLRTQLNGLNANVEFCDEAGRTIGHFVPDELYKKLVISWFNSQVSDEELERLRAQKGGRSLQEIWKSRRIDDIHRRRSDAENNPK